jgi:hypothetical protein
MTFYFYQIKNKILHFVDIAFQKIKGKEIFYAFGDSHLEVFNYINYNYNEKYYFDVTAVGGATALGIVNPNSATNSLEIFNKKISRIKNKSSYLFFLLGEVDTGFLIWYRSMKYNNSIELQLQKSIDNYICFLESLKIKGFKKIYILSAPLPTIKDGQNLGEIANLRKEIKATQIERTQLTIRYNEELKTRILRLGFVFLSTSEELIDKNKGIIKDKYLNKDPCDHHLDSMQYSSLIIYKLKHELTK